MNTSSKCGTDRRRYSLAWKPGEAPLLTNLYDDSEQGSGEVKRVLLAAVEEYLRQKRHLTPKETQLDRMEGILKEILTRPIPVSHETVESQAAPALLGVSLDDFE